MGNDDGIRQDIGVFWILIGRFKSLSSVTRKSQKTALLKSAVLPHKI